MNTTVRRWGIPLGILALMTVITAIVNDPFSKAETRKEAIEIDGSSTVYPITKLMASEFNSSRNKKVEINVGISGTTGGFKKFCEGKTDISDASRPILKEEIAVCQKRGVKYIELPIAFDALTIVVNPKNDWANDITIAELKKIWEPTAQGKITKWNQIRSSWPDKPLNLYGPDKDSGTYDYFMEAIKDESKTTRNDYTSNKDDNMLVKGVSQDPNGLGYFGFAYYEANTTQLKALAVDSGKGSTMPSPQAMAKNLYQPLTRPLFIYINYHSAQVKPEVKEFVDFYLAKAPKLVNQVGYIPLSEEVYHLDLVQFNQGEVGTVFNGVAELNLTLAEVLRKRATLF
ncbi:MAG: PstS family phosphate ABC transporter substrate-binding protein [Spirirestis rafaelensis WJT71-NPBG6]|jgi:phosphate transport system substrate-binding protein|nr:PstS family phosphate ABC transporter substrate-binding protein [Spirirestis rafaelensis WJT71-NPBG6]